MKYIAALVFFLLLGNHLFAQADHVFELRFLNNEIQLMSIDLSDGTATPIGPVENVNSYASALSTFDSQNGHFIFHSNLGLTVADVNDASIVGSYSNLPFGGLYEYYNSKAYTLSFNNDEVHLVSIDLAAGTAETIGSIANVSSIASASSTFDFQNGHFIFHSNLGLTVVDVNDASIVNSYFNVPFGGILEYHDAKSYTLSFIDDAINLVSTDVIDGTVEAIGPIINVSSFASASSTFDFQNEHFIFQSNLGLTVVDINDASIVSSYSNIPSGGLFEFNNAMILATPEDYFEQNNTIYPNPTSGEITLVLSQKSNVDEVLIYGIDGKVIYAVNQFSQEAIRFKLPDYPGIYIVAIKSASVYEIIKLVKI